MSTRHLKRKGSMLPYNMRYYYIMYIWCFSMKTACRFFLRFFQHSRVMSAFVGLTYSHRWALSPISLIIDIGLSLISDWAWYRNVRYRTEVRIVRHYIGYLKKVMSDIRYPTLMFVNSRSAVVRQQILDMTLVRNQWHTNIINRISIESFGNNLSILDIGISDIDLVQYQNGSWYRYRNSSNIGMRGFSPTYFVPISEYEMSMSDVGYRRHESRCRCPPMHTATYSQRFSNKVFNFKVDM